MSILGWLKEQLPPGSLVQVDRVEFNNSGVTAVTIDEEHGEIVVGPELVDVDVEATVKLPPSAEHVYIELTAPQFGD